MTAADAARRLLARPSARRVERALAGPRVRRALSAVLVVVVALVAAVAAMTAWGSSDRDIGPLRARVSFVPSTDGGVRVEVPPLGRLELPTHVGPLQVAATVTGIRPDRARALLTASRPGATVTDQVTADSQDAVAAAAAKAVLVALGASAVTCAVVFRRRRAVLGGTAAVAVVLAGSAAVAGATLRTEALDEPRFDGLLVQAPALIGRVQDFDAYSARVAELTANVARVYADLATLPSAPSADSTRVLWVSDIHNNPAAYRVMGQLVEQFDVAAIVDTGDIVDVGTDVENRLIRRVGTFDVPYVFVRGNHDSRSITQRFLEEQPGAIALDDGETVEIAGVRIAGIGDPLFRPNKQSKEQIPGDNARLLDAGERLLAAIDADPAPVDVVLVHNPKVAEPLMGRVPLVLDGHTHERAARVQDGTLELTQGSSGGAGLRTLDGEEEGGLPLQMSVLHFDATGALLAVDDITVGGLGERSVTVERRTPQSYGDVEAASGPQG